MKVLRLFLVAAFAAILLAALAGPTKVSSQTGPTEAPQNFDNTNGLEDQGDINTPGTFLGDRFIFEARDDVAKGLGPVYNAQSCAECHQNRATGGVSQIMETRAGHSGPDGNFVDAPGGSLIQTRSINTKIQERVPDGARITYVNNSSQVSVMGWDGGQYGPLAVTSPSVPATGSSPAFSPDGKRIAFSANGGIWIVNNDGTNPNLMTIGGSDLSPTWSPDGTKIAFSSSQTGLSQIFVMDQDGQNVTNISNSTFSDSQPSWSPDGMRIAFVRSPGKIFAMNANGMAQTQVTLGAGTDEHPSYSPDSSMIAFSTNRDGNFEIYKIPAVGGVAVRLTNDPASDRNPAWAPDNTAIAFGSNRIFGNTNVWAIAPDGTTPTTLSPPSNGGGDFPAYSKDQGETVRTFRSSLNLFGDGFVECINDPTLIAIRDGQPSNMRGTAIQVDVLESPDQTRIGRFGWKDQHGSLLSFSSDAYLNEMGITNRFNLSENSSLGRSVAAFDPVPDNQLCASDGGNCGEDGEEDINAFTRFMRSTSAPTRDNTLVPNDAADPGSALFDSLSCSVCHVRNITTAPKDSVINGGQFVVPEKLGDKIIHPFGDFLLHDIGTGDGIVQNGGEATRNMIRTAPLWGLRTHDKFMHDGGSSSAPSNSGAQSFALNEAILRHAGQATISRTGFQALTTLQKAQLIRFLKSL